MNPLALPLAWKVAGVALLLALLTGGYLAWTYHQREIGRQEIIAKDAKALAEQAVKDRALSEKLVADLSRKISDREATAQPVREVVKYVTPTTCPADDALDAAAQWVRDSLSEAGRSPAGRQPAPALGKAPAATR